MTIGPHDSHALFDDLLNRVKLFDAQGEEILRVEARNVTVVHRTWWKKYGPLPRGEYVFGVPIPMNQPAFGYWAIPIFDAKKPGWLKRYNRSGLFAHGGGSGLKDPFASHQGWQNTHGCLRFQNSDLAKLVAEVKRCQHNFGQVWLTVQGPAA